MQVKKKKKGTNHDLESESQDIKKALVLAMGPASVIQASKKLDPRGLSACVRRERVQM